MILLHGKSYYPANAYPLWFPASIINRRYKKMSRVAQFLMASAVVLLGLATVPRRICRSPQAQAASYQDGLLSCIWHISRTATATEHQSASPSFQ